MPNGSYRPGDKVPVTGIYTATHHQHRMQHEVFAVEGDQFPSCRKCAGRTRFALLQAATHIDADRDFAKAAESSKAKKAKAGNRKNP